MKKKVVTIIGSIIIAITILSLIGGGVWLIFYGELHFYNSRKFKNDIKEEHELIKSIEFWSNGNTVFCDFYISPEISIDEVKNICKKTREYLMSEKVFESLVKVHKKRYGSDFFDIQIDLDTIKNDKKMDYRFYSRRKGGQKVYDGFKTWYFEHNGKSEEL